MKYREKIAEIIKKNGTYNGRSLSFDYYVVQPDALATALIENGIGDIIEWKRRAEVAERALKDMCEEYEDNFECDLYVVSTESSYEDTRFYIYKERKAAEEAFNKLVSLLKASYSTEELGGTYTIDEDCGREHKSCTVYRAGRYNEDHECISLQKSIIK